MSIKKQRATLEDIHKNAIIAHGLAATLQNYVISGDDWDFTTLIIAIADYTEAVNIGIDEYLTKR